MILIFPKPKSPPPLLSMILLIGAIGSVSTCTLGGDPMMSLSVAVHHPSLLQVLEEKYQALNYEEAIEHGRK